MTYYIQISTIDWPKDRVLFEDTLNTLEKLCDTQNGYILNEPVSKFGWTFIDMILKAELHMPMEQEFAEQIKKSKGLRIKVIRFKSGMTYDKLAASSPLGKYALDKLRLLNGHYPDDNPVVGELIKIVE